MYIPAPPEMLEAMMSMKGKRKDVDKEYKNMTEEGIHYYLWIILHYRKGSV